MLADPRSAQHKPPHLIEAAFLVLLLVASTGAFFRFGLATGVWGVLYLGTGALILAHADAWLKTASQAWPLLLFPAFCLLSTLWSEDPSATLRNALQYVCTVAMAVYVGARFAPHQLIGYLCAAMAICIAVSVMGTSFAGVAGYQQQDYVGAERYFVGLYPQKNMMGLVIVMAVMSIIAVGLIYRQKALAFTAAALISVVVFEAKSTTALLLCVAALSTYGFWWLFTHSTRAVLGSLLGGAVACLAILLVLGSQLPVFESVLETVGKDHTLTGRTAIWEAGWSVGSAHPLLGVGYQAFWSAPSFAGDVLSIRAAVLDTIGGFHNAYLEAWVATGLIGLALFCLIPLTGLAVAVRCLSGAHRDDAFAALALMIVITARSFTESTGHYQHDLEFILLVALATSLYQFVLKPEKTNQPHGEISLGAAR